MKVFVEALPELLGTLGSTGILSAVAWYVGRRRTNRQTAAHPEPHPVPQLAEYQTIRRYTLLGSTGREGEPIQVMSTRSAGAVLVWRIEDRQEQFELTDIRLFDGTFAAEPANRFKKIC